MQAGEDMDSQQNGRPPGDIVEEHEVQQGRTPWDLLEDQGLWSGEEEQDPPLHDQQQGEHHRAPVAENGDGHLGGEILVSPGLPDAHVPLRVGGAGGKTPCDLR